MKSILNSTQLYNLAPYKYPWAIDMFRNAIKNTWTPEEIGVGQDVSQYPHLSEDDQHTFKTVFSTLTTSDLAIQRNLAVEVYSCILNPEMAVYLGRQIYEEANHTLSYQYIIEHLGLNEQEIYTLYLNVPEICHKFTVANRYTAYFQEYRETGDVSALLKGLIFYYLIWEGTWFVAGFAPIFAMARRNVMKGTADQLSYIWRDECVIEGTEVLTTEGWRPVEALNKSIKIAQWEEGKGISFVNPIYLSKHKPKTCFRFNNNDYLEQIVTPKHRICYYTKSGRLKVVEAKDATPNPYSKFINTDRLAIDQKRKLTANEQLRIAIQADGSITSRSNKSDTITLSFKKERKIKETKEIFSILDLKHTTITDKKGYTTFRFLTKPGVYEKNLNWIDLEKIDYSWCANFIEQVIKWDGHINKNTPFNTVIYCSTDKSCINLVQAVASLAGYKTHITKTTDNRKNTYKNYYRLSIQKSTNTTQGGCISKKEHPNDKMFYGIQVPSSFMVIRYNGKVSITGNTMHYAFGTKLIKALMAEHPKTVLTTKEVHDIMEECVDAERTYIEYAVRPTIGYNANDHMSYVRHLVDRRLTALNYEAMYRAPNPLPWLAEMATIKKEKNFFETRVTDYQAGGALVWD